MGGMQPTCCGWFRGDMLLVTKEGGSRGQRRTVRQGCSEGGIGSMDKRGVGVIGISVTDKGGVTHKGGGTDKGGISNVDENEG